MRGKTPNFNRLDRPDLERTLEDFLSLQALPLEAVRDGMPVESEKWQRVMRQLAFRWTLEEKRHAAEIDSRKVL